MRKEFFAATENGIFYDRQCTKKLGVHLLIKKVAFWNKMEG